MNKKLLDFVYPNGARKAVTLRFDDGPSADRKMVEMLNRYHMKATFYLVRSKLDSGYGVRADEVKELYRGHEIANHTFSHKDPRRHELSSEFIEKDLADGKRALEELIGTDVWGYAYVCSTFGDIGADEYKRLLAKTGHKYAIMGRENHCFEPDANDRFDVGQSFRFTDGALIQKAEEFCALDEKELSMMLVMAHTYEFDDQKYSCDWEKAELFYKVVSGRDDIWYATNGEVVRYLLDAREYLKGESMQNTTSSTLYISANGNVIPLAPGETLKI